MSDETNKTMSDEAKKRTEAGRTWSMGNVAWCLPSGVLRPQNSVNSTAKIEAGLPAEMLPINIVWNFYNNLCGLQNLLKESDFVFFKNLAEQIEESKKNLKSEILSIVGNTYSYGEEPVSDLNKMTALFFMKQQKKAQALKNQKDLHDTVLKHWVGVFQTSTNNAQNPNDTGNHGVKFLCNKILEVCKNTCSDINIAVYGKEDKTVSLEYLYSFHMKKMTLIESKGQDESVSIDMLNYDSLCAGMGIEILGLVYNYVQELTDYIDTYVDYISKPVLPDIPSTLEGETEKGE